MEIEPKLNSTYTFAKAMCCHFILPQLSTRFSLISVIKLRYQNEADGGKADALEKKDNYPHLRITSRNPSQGGIAVFVSTDFSFKNQYHYDL